VLVRAISVTLRLALAFVLPAAVGACTASAPPAEPRPIETLEAHRAAVEAGRREHEESYRRQYVPIAGLHPLKPGVNTAGSGAGRDIPLPPSTPATLGTFVVEGDQVRFQPQSDVAVLLKGQRVTAPVVLTDDGGTAAADELVAGAVTMVVHVNGQTRGIRVRDPDGPIAKGFLGFSWFDFDHGAKVTGRFIRDAAPRPMRVANTYGELNDFTTEGVVEFSWGGQTLRLRPFTTRPGRFFFVFRDASSGEETYEAARFLYADLEDDGSVALEFNVAYNPPCAFNMYTTCPIPLPENRLPVKILAGEKNYPVKVPFVTTDPRAARRSQ
jgi:uncharacterized protein (DUF1684 family)